jgi:hypothetical protein
MRDQNMIMSPAALYCAREAQRQLTTGPSSHQRGAPHINKLQLKQIKIKNWSSGPEVCLKPRVNCRVNVGRDKSLTFNISQEQGYLV